MNLEVPLNIEVSPAESSEPTLEVLFQQFEERYKIEGSEIKNNANGMREMLAQTETVLNELDDRPIWKRIMHRLSGHTSRLNRVNFRNQLKLQNSSMMLMVAITRQNQMIMDGLSLTLEKLEKVEKEAQAIKEQLQPKKAGQSQGKGFWRRLFSVFRIQK